MLREYLSKEQFDVTLAHDGNTALRLVDQTPPDIVLLDVTMPSLGGFDVLRRLRGDTDLPVLMLTARDDYSDRVHGLELGADDYLTKPFSLRELLARVKAILRRTAGSGPAAAKALLGRLEVNFAGYTATSNGAPVEMTPKEFDVLKFLWDHRNQTVSRDALLTNVWGYDEPLSTRTIDNFILRLRQKLEEDPAHPRVILTVHGIGYKLVPHQEQ
jgi:DNA-binding response OmpR family regulator